MHLAGRGAAHVHFPGACGFVRLGIHVRSAILVIGIARQIRMRIFSRPVFHDVAVLRLAGHASHPSLFLGFVSLVIGKLVGAGVGVLLLNFERASNATAFVPALFVTRCAGLLRERAKDEQGSDNKCTNVFQGGSFPARADCYAA